MDTSAVWSEADFRHELRIRNEQRLACYPAWVGIVARSGGQIGIQPIENWSEVSPMLRLAFLLHLFPAPIVIRWPALRLPRSDSILIRKGGSESVDNFLKRIIEQELGGYRKQPNASPYLALTLPDGVEQLCVRTYAGSPDVYKNLIIRLLSFSPTKELFLTPYE